MAYNVSYGMGPNAQYQYENMFRPQSYNVGSANDLGGGDLVQNRNYGNQYNMQAPSAYAPENRGGPGNPNGANNMAKPLLPRFKAPTQTWGGGPNGQWNGDFSQFANQQNGGYNGSGINPGNVYGMVQQLQGMNAPSGFTPSARGFGQGGSGAQQGAQDQDMMQRQQQIPRTDTYYRRPNMGGDPFNQYGFAGQSQSLGRYQPPMMSNPYDPSGGWLGSGGYAYNIPNSYGSGQWNQFNSTDMSNRNFGQSQNAGPPPQNVRYRQPTYQSPFATGDQGRSQNYYAYLSSLNQPPQYTQPGSPDQPGPST